MAVVDVIRKQSSKVKNLMHFLRRLFLVCLEVHCNTFLKTKHIPGKFNIVADLLSGFQFRKSREAAPFLE